MQSTSFILRSIALLSSAAIVVSTPAVAAKAKVKRPRAAAVRAPARPPVGIQRPTGEVYLSTGRGQLINLPTPISDIFVSNDSVADVRVQSPTQLYLFGKAEGETSVYATTRGGQVVYSTNVRVAQNFGSLDQMLKLAMPDTDVKATLAGQVAVLTGTVKSPDDIEQAGSLARAYLNPGIDANAAGAQLKVMVVNRLKTATPLQVTLQVRIAEVSRTLSKEIGANLITRDTSTGGFNFGVAQGRNFGSIAPQDIASLPLLDASARYGFPAGTLKLPFDPATGQFVITPAAVGKFTTAGAGKTTLSFLGRLFGLDVGGALDLAETEGFVTTLATPNLTALSGQTATFLAGGEIPLPLTNTNANTGLQTTSINYRQYGITLEFSPTVLADGRISLHVKPEVSDLDYQSAVTIDGSVIPGFQTRRADTTIELGSGQSFVIGGLLRASNTNNMQRTPGVGNVPVLGALFRSNGYKRGETELMIVVTPYLVTPVPASQIVLPTDGYKTPTDIGRVFTGEMYKGSSERRPVPTMAPPQTVAQPQIGSASTPSSGKSRATSPAPGFGN